jgi:hypothetical protein
MLLVTIVLIIQVKCNVLNTIQNRNEETMSFTILKGKVIVDRQSPVTSMST